MNPHDTIDVYVFIEHMKGLVNRGVSIKTIENQLERFFKHCAVKGIAKHQFKAGEWATLFKAWADTQTTRNER